MTYLQMSFGTSTRRIPLKISTQIKKKIVKSIDTNNQSIDSPSLDY